MRAYLNFLLIPVIFCMAAVGCKDSPVEPEEVITGEGDLLLSGSVIDNTSEKPLAGAIVSIIYGDSSASRVTNSAGEFAAVITIDKSEQVELITFYEGYYVDTTNVEVVGGQDESIDIKLQEKVIGNDVAGDPASIVLISTSAQSIGVKESGSVETAIITFEVQDSVGNPINIDHSVTVDFSLGSSPGGGEYISPSSVKTNDKGIAIVSISSGTKAGVVQFIAQIGDSILSKPVNIAIHGGHPDQNHLTVYPQFLNIAGWKIAGNTNLITVIVGDKYANPVKPLTAIYFTTTGGIIEGSALTDNLGHGAVELISGNPLPVHPILGPGFATIYVSTADENYNKIVDSTVVLFSGKPIITANPVNFPDVSHGSETTILYTIKDENGNPIAPGNQVSVTVTSGESVQVEGDVNFTTIDTQNSNLTNFSFKVVDADVEDPVGSRNVSVNISVSGPNGSDEFTVSGIVN